MRTGPEPVRAMDCTAAPVLASLRMRAGIALLLLAGSAVLWGLAQRGFYPMAWLAVQFSEDGYLTEAYRQLIEDSQQQLALALMLAGGLASWVPAGRVVGFILHLPFRWLASLAGLAALGLGLGMQEWLFDGIPHLTDAASHLFQAKILAQGDFFVSPPACPDAFWQSHVLMTTGGKWFTKYSPGHALVLAAGLRMGLLKWMIPVCAALALVALGKLLEVTASRTQARVFMGLFLFSPLALLLSGSFMSHTSAFAFAAGGILAWVCSRRMAGPGMARLLEGVAGLLLAGSAMIRPQDFAMMGLMGFLLFLTLKGREWLRLLRTLPLLLLGAMPVLAFWLVYNKAIYGTPFALGYGYTLEGVLRPSFQGTFGFTPAFGFRDALALLVWNIDRANLAFLGWPSSLVFIPFAFSRERPRLLFLACAGIAVVVGTYFFYGIRTEYEIRYYFLCLPFFVYLTARGIRNLVCWRTSPAWRAGALQAVFVLCAAFYLYSALYYWPRYLIPKYQGNYEDCSIEIEKTVRARGLENALVLIGPDDGASFFYTSGFIFNDPELKRGVIYARNLPKELACLRRSFPDRRFYRYDHTLEGPDRLVPFD